MSNKSIKALTFDTGGTILDWHTGFRDALSALGKKHDVDRDWASLGNEYRRRTLQTMLNHGENEPASKNFDDVHREVLQELALESGLDSFSDDDLKTVYWDALHNLSCWPDFPSVLPRLRDKFICVSFTLLSVRNIVDTARRNGLSWDAVISCEVIGKYKLLPEAYHTCAKFLQLDPSECCMVACHNFDLDAAKACGYQTAFVFRPDEWGHESPPSPEPNPHHDIVAKDFPDLARQLGLAE